MTHLESKPGRTEKRDTQRDKETGGEREIGEGEREGQG